MKNGVKKCLAMLLALAMIASMAACGKGGDTTTTTTTTAKADEKTTAAQGGDTETTAANAGDENGIENGAYVDAVTFSWAVMADAAMKFAEGDSYEDNVWSRYIKDELNIDLEVAFSADNGTGAYGNQLTMCIANNDLPDTFFSYYGNYAECAKAGMLTDMLPYIEQYGSDRLKKIIADNEELIEACKIDGKLYAIPALSSSSDYAINSQFLWIRQDWLDALDLDAPTTWDELVEVARAFTTQDPDGNGVNDTYGLAISGAEPWWYGVGEFEGVAAAFHATGYQEWVATDDGIVYGGVQEEMKNALAGAKALYDEGLLNSDFAIQSGWDATSDMYNNRVGMTFGKNWAGYWPFADAVAENNAAVWTPYAYVSADDEPAVCNVWWPLDGFFCVSATAEHPEAAVLIANLYCETLNSETTDEVNEKYSYSGDTSVYMLCPVRVSEGGTELETYRQVKAVAEGSMSADELTGAYKTNYDAIQSWVVDGDVAGYGYWSQLGIGGAASIIVDQYIPNGQIQLDAIHGGFPVDYDDEMGLIKEKEIEMYCKIITGEYDLEEGWAAWLQAFDDLGGQECTDAVNAAFGN